MAGVEGIITNRLSQLGLPLASFVDKITVPKDQRLAQIAFTWRSDPGGPKAVFREFVNLISRNPNFGADTPQGSKLHPNDVCYREVNRTDSLHVIFNTRSGGSVHIDTVSPVAGRDANGFLLYDYGKVLEHWVADVKNHKELIVPGSGGLAFGFRF